ncbi:MAG: nucleoside 2-deoxyribosyltransferase [Deltaproteobacteria bacterium]|nr:nucleoside 2-deoxyribosyltransferase [Deltaproteobacteria bacterium]
MKRKRPAAGGKAGKTIVYCSGPLFCPEERRGMEDVARVLEAAGYKTFLPHRDGLESHVLSMANDPRGQAPGLRRVATLVNKAIFALDAYQVLSRCHALVLNMNGRVPDEGGVAETAMAFAAGKPVVLYKDDARTKFLGADNCMVTGLSSPDFCTVSRLADLPAEVARTVQRTRENGNNLYEPPPEVRRVLDRGRKIWRMVSAFHAAGAAPRGSARLVARAAGLVREP